MELQEDFEEFEKGRKKVELHVKFVYESSILRVNSSISSASALST